MGKAVSEKNPWRHRRRPPSRPRRRAARQAEEAEAAGRLRLRRRAAADRGIPAAFRARRGQAGSSPGFFFPHVLRVGKGRAGNRSQMGARAPGGRPGAEKAPLPFNVSLGEPVSSYPLVDAGLGLLELSFHSVEFETASKLLRS